MGRFVKAVPVGAVLVMALAGTLAPISPFAPAPAATAAPAPAEPAPAEPAAIPKVYVALGDSYASGEGIGPFSPGSSSGGDSCHRSLEAYPELLASEEGLELSFVACSGATTANVTSQGQYGELPQLDQAALRAGPALVTITIGGNDAGYLAVLTQCFEQRLVGGLTDPLGLVSSVLGLLDLPGPDPNCAGSASFVAGVEAAIQAAGASAESAYAAVRRQVGASGRPQANTSVIATGYPLLFPTAPADQECLGLSLLVTPEEQDFLNAAVVQLDSALRAAAAQAGVNFVDPSAAFAGHGICGSAGAWINGLILADGAFHPNPAGQAGYEAAIGSFIAAATNRTPDGFPADPAPRDPRS